MSGSTAGALAASSVWVVDNPPANPLPSSSPLAAELAVPTWRPGLRQLDICDKWITSSFGELLMHSNFFKKILTFDVQCQNTSPKCSKLQTTHHFRAYNFIGFILFRIRSLTTSILLKLLHNNVIMQKLRKYTW